MTIEPFPVRVGGSTLRGGDLLPRCLVSVSERIPKKSQHSLD